MDSHKTVIKRFLFAFAFWAVFLNSARIYGTDIFTAPVLFSTGSSLQITSGVQLSGTWEFITGTTITFDSGSVINGLSLPVTLTGNVTGTGTGTVPTTVVGLQDLVSLPGSILSTNITPPVAPAAGFIKWYSNSADKRFHDVNDAGTTGTTVVSNTGGTNLFLTGVGTNGVITTAQPAFTNLSGGLVITQEPSIAANSVIGNATGGAAVPTAVGPLSARSPSLLNVDENTQSGDTNYTVLSTDRSVSTNAAFTTARTWTLPTANSINNGQSLTLQDGQGTLTSTNTLTINRTGTDLINPGGTTSTVLRNAGQSVTLLERGGSTWEHIAFYPGVPTSGNFVQGDGNEWAKSAYALPTIVPTTAYSLVSNGTGIIGYPTAGRLVNSSTANQTGFGQDQYLTGSTITVNTGDWKVGGQYTCFFDMTKTASGTGPIAVTVRIGTAGTIADASFVSFTYPAGTAAVDTGFYVVRVIFQAVGASGIAQMAITLDKTLTNTGLSNTANTNVVSLATGSATSTTTATKIGVSFNGNDNLGFNGTNKMVMATLNQP